MDNIIGWCIRTNISESKKAIEEEDWWLVNGNHRTFLLCSLLRSSLFLSPLNLLPQRKSLFFQALLSSNRNPNLFSFATSDTHRSPPWPIHLFRVNFVPCGTTTTSSPPSGDLLRRCFYRRRFYILRRQRRCFLAPRWLLAVTHNRTHSNTIQRGPQSFLVRFRRYTLLNLINGL